MNTKAYAYCLIFSVIYCSYQLQSSGYLGMYAVPFQPDDNQYHLSAVRIAIDLWTNGPVHIFNKALQGMHSPLVETLLGLVYALAGVGKPSLLIYFTLISTIVLATIQRLIERERPALFVTSLFLLTPYAAHLVIDIRPDLIWGFAVGVYVFVSSGIRFENRAAFLSLVAGLAMIAKPTAVLFTLWICSVCLFVTIFTERKMMDIKSFTKNLSVKLVIPALVPMLIAIMLLIINQKHLTTYILGHFQQTDLIIAGQGAFKNTLFDSPLFYLNGPPAKFMLGHFYWLGYFMWVAHIIWALMAQVMSERRAHIRISIFYVFLYISLSIVPIKSNFFVAPFSFLIILSMLYFIQRLLGYRFLSHLNTPMHFGAMFTLLGAFLLRPEFYHRILQTNYTLTQQASNDIGYLEIITSINKMLVHSQSLVDRPLRVGLYMEGPFINPITQIGYYISTHKSSHVPWIERIDHAIARNAEAVEKNLPRVLKNYDYLILHGPSNKSVYTWQVNIDLREWMTNMILRDPNVIVTEFGNQDNKVYLIRILDS